MPARDRDPKVSRAFGRVVRLARVRRDLKQFELAQAAGVSQDTLSRFERGEREPSLGVLLRLAYALDLRPRQLVDALEEELSR